MVACSGLQFKTVYKKACFLLSGIWLSATMYAHADGMAFVDPRSAAMGGTGVASASLSSAAFFNPALLALPTGSEHIGVSFLGLSLHAADSSNYRTDYNNARDLVNNTFPAVQNDIRQLQQSSNPTAAQTTQLANDSQALLNGIVGFSGHDYTVAPDFMPVSVAIHNPLLSFGVFTNSQADLVGRLNATAADQNYLNGYIGFVRQLAQDQQNGTTTGLYNSPYLQQGCLTGLTASSVAKCLSDPSQGRTSDIQVVGLATSEIGVALAENWSGWALGVSPKLMSVRTFFYDQTVHANQSFSLSGSSKTYTTANMDVGAARNFGWIWPLKVGVSVRNLIPEDFNTAVSNGQQYAVRIRPQVTAGGELHIPGVTLTSDLDLSREYAPVAWGADSQFLGVGAEFSAWLVKLRLGVRQNLIQGPIRNEWTGGVALGPFDLGLVYSDHSAALAGGFSLNF